MPDWKQALDKAQERDASDPLARFRERFYVQPDTIYLDGNSLGLLSRDAETAVLRVLAEWRDRGIDGWSAGPEPWYELAERLSPQLAALVGALPHEVIATGATTVNLHQMLATWYKPTAERRVLVVDELNFPSDLYAAESHIRLHGGEPARDLRVVKAHNGQLLLSDIEAALRSDVALAFFSGVLYQSGQLLPMQAIVQAAHRAGAVVGFDLSHAIGAVPCVLHDTGVDFAFWCHYKYLNSGPGSVAGLFVHEDYADLQPGLAGWWGSHKERQFAMQPQFDPASGAGRWQIGTPHVLSLAPLQGSLAVFAEAGMGRLREKSLALTELLMQLIDSSAEETGLQIGTPRSPTERGGHVAVHHPEAARIGKALKSHSVIPDFRPPDVIRLAPVPLYTRFVDVVNTARILIAIVNNREYEQFSDGRDVIA